MPRRVSVVYVPFRHQLKIARMTFAPSTPVSSSLPTVTASSSPPPSAAAPVVTKGPQPVLQPATRNDSTPPADAAEHKGKFYKVFTTNLTWHEAKKKCEEMGGHLAVIKTEEQSRFVVRQASTASVDTVWLGATDEMKEGQWLWVDGTKMTFSNWGPQQPNNKMDAEHYLVLIVSRPPDPRLVGTWHDQPDHSTQHTLGFVCQWERPPKTADDGWLPLFNGKDLTGWKANVSPEKWRIEDGAIVGRGQVSHLFYVGTLTRKSPQFKNFHFRAELLTEPNSNSGVYFHTKWQDAGFLKSGYEAQVHNAQTDSVKTGS